MNDTAQIAILAVMAQINDAQGVLLDVHAELSPGCAGSVSRSRQWAIEEAIRNLATARSGLAVVSYVYEQQ